MHDRLFGVTRLIEFCLPSNGELAHDRCISATGKVSGDTQMALEVGVAMIPNPEITPQGLMFGSYSHSHRARGQHGAIRQNTAVSESCASQPVGLIGMHRPALSVCCEQPLGAGRFINLMTRVEQGPLAMAQSLDHATIPGAVATPPDVYVGGTRGAHGFGHARRQQTGCGQFGQRGRMPLCIAVRGQSVFGMSLLYRRTMPLQIAHDSLV